MHFSLTLPEIVAERAEPVTVELIMPVPESDRLLHFTFIAEDVCPLQLSFMSPPLKFILPLAIPETDMPNVFPFTSVSAE